MTDKGFLFLIHLMHLQISKKNVNTSKGKMANEVEYANVKGRNTGDS